MEFPLDCELLFDGTTAEAETTESEAVTMVVLTEELLADVIPVMETDELGKNGVDDGELETANEGEEVNGTIGPGACVTTVVLRIVFVEEGTTVAEMFPGEVSVE